MVHLYIDIVFIVIFLLLWNDRFFAVGQQIIIVSQFLITFFDIHKSEFTWSIVVQNGWIAWSFEILSLQATFLCVIVLSIN